MRTALLVAAISLVTLAALGQTLGHDFLDYDDDIYVVENPNLREGPTPAAIWGAFRAPYEANWIPLTFVSLQVDYALFGLNPAGYHATNLALHLATALLLFFGLRRMTGHELPAAWVAAIFAIHPLHVESVAWIAERKDTLSGFFFVLTLLAYARYAEAPSARRYVAVFGAFVLSLLAKPMAVTLPFVLWLLDVWPLRRIPWRGLLPAPTARIVLEKVPLLLASVGVSAIALQTQGDAGSFMTAELFPLPVRSANAALSYVAYLRDTVWPTNLAVFYPHPRDTVSFSGALVATLGLAAVTAALIRHGRRQPYLAVGWLWFLGMLLPVSGLLQVGIQARADRYMYLPLIGLSIATAWGVREAARTPLARRLALAFGAASVVALAVVTSVQTTHWRNTETLFRHAGAVTDDNWLAHQWVGVLLLEQGDLGAAEVRFREALRIQPRWSEVHLGIADVHAERGHWSQAILAYSRARSLRPKDAKPHMRLARALVAAGQLERGVESAREAVRLADAATAANANFVLGSILMLQGAQSEALKSLETALELDPQLAEAHLLRGLVLLFSWRLPEADTAIATGARLGIARPKIARALAALAQRARDRGDELLAEEIEVRESAYADVPDRSAS